MPPLLVGHGLDSHRLVPDRRLVIGGVTIDSPRGAEAHSDGDVLLHALCDALLSTASLGDIGQHFPDTDGLWLDFDSARMVEQVLVMLHESNVGSLVNVAAVVILDAPKLAPRRDDITTSLAALLGLPRERVAVTYKTSEGLAPDHIQASVTLLVSSGGRPTGHPAMETTIDSAGRIVVPKPLRDALGLVPGSKLDVSAYGAGLQLVPVGRTAATPDERARATYERVGVSVEIVAGSTG